MKRFFYFSMMAIAMMMFACSTSSSTPSDALLEYVDLLKAGKYEQFVEGMAFKEGLTQEQIQEQKAMWASLLQEKGAKEYEKLGGLKGIEITSEEISEDGNSAVIKFKQTFGDGTTKDGSQAMVKRDGKWLMDINK